VVAASIELLDAAGEEGLTVRALTAHLATGRGAIYHHVSGKEDLLAAATDGIISPIVGAGVTQAAGEEDPYQALRVLALGIFDAIDAHPWVGVQLSRQPQPAVFRLWGRIGALLQDLGVTGTALSDAGSALLSYVLGATAQYATGARQAPDDAAREKYLAELAAQWVGSEANPLAHEATSGLVEHDDREQFLAGVDIFLTGITALK